MIERIDEIVEEVIRRIKLLLNEKRILLILRDDSDFKQTEILVENLKANGYTFHLLSLLTKDLKTLEKPVFHEMKVIRSSIFKEEQYEHFMAAFEGLIISDLKCLEVQAYHELYFSETLGKLVFHTIKEDKPVYAFSKEMTGVKNAYLKEQMDEIMGIVKKLKIHILTEKMRRADAENFDETGTINNEGSISGNTENSGKRSNSGIGKSSENTGERNREKRKVNENYDDFILREKFVTLSDLTSLKKDTRELKVSTDARLTMEASDYLARNRIELVRIEERI